MFFGLEMLAFLALPVVMIVLILRRRSKSDAMLFIGGLPSGPTLKPLEYLFPGRSTPPDPMPTESQPTLVDTRGPKKLPAGLRQKEDFGDRPTRQ
jgi:hypothetical protein